MPDILKRLLSGGWLVLLLMSAPLQGAPLDLVLLMDASASVARIDPEGHRLRLARALIDHLDRRDRAAVIAFDQDIYPLTPLLTLDRRDHRRRLLEALAELPAGGFYTDLPSALEAALVRLRGHPERARAIVLVSDGHIQLADEAQFADHTQYLLLELIPRIAKRKMRLFTVAPGPAANDSLLRMMAEDGRGLFLRLEGGRAAEGMARRILALAHRGGSPPLAKTPLEIPADTRVAIIEVRPQGERPVLRLYDPKGKQDTPTPARGDDGHLYLRLDLPRPGTWTLRHRKVDDIHLHLDPTANLQLQSGDPIQGAPLQFAAWIQDRHGPNPRLQRLPLRLFVTQPDGTRLELPLNDQGQHGDEIAADGIHGTLFVPTQAGAHLLHLESHLGPYPLINEASLEIHPPPAPEPPPPPAHPPEAAPADDHAPPDEADDPAAQEDEEAGGLGLVFWLSLLWILLMLGGGGAGLWWWLKKKKGAAKKGDAEDDEGVEIAED